MTLVIGIVRVIALLIQMAAGVVDLAESFKMMRRERKPVVGPRRVRAFDPDPRGDGLGLEEARNVADDLSGVQVGSSTN